MKNFIMAILTSVSFASIAKADPGAPKSFTLLTSVSGPTITGQVSELELKNLKMSQDDTCQDGVANFDYAGPAIHLTIGDQDYVLDQSTSVSLSFNSDSCDLNMQNIQGFTAKFDNTKLRVSIGVDFELVNSYIQIGSRDLGAMTGTITSHY